MEEYAYVLDYLPQGRADDKSYHKTAIALAVGETEFKLLEIIPKANAVMAIGDRIYIGKEQDRRDKVMSVKRRISYSDLTNAATTELPFTLETIIGSRENDFIKFFNEAESISTRMHSLELLPGLGNKTMWNILDERKKKPFESFHDLTERVKTVHNPQKMIAGRITIELQERYEKHKLFVAR